MIAEHAFITILEPAAALAAARSLLEAMGLSHTHGDGRSLRMNGGRKNPHKYKHLWDQPHQVGLEYDRGRVSLAVLLQQPGKPTAAHRQWVLAVGRALEKVLVHNQPATFAITELDTALRMADEDHRKKRRWFWVLVTFVSLVFGLIALGIVGAIVNSMK